jgi:hypothetical protein
MVKLAAILTVVTLAVASQATELRLDFSQFPLGETPTGYSSLISGEGKPGAWKVVNDEVPVLPDALSTNESSALLDRPLKRFVLAQTAQDAVDEHFPILLYNGDTFGDFTLTTRFKILSGKIDQMAGLVFRAKDEKNYYVIRASALGKSVRFFKFVGGLRNDPIGPEVVVTTNEWHELTIICQGSEIRWLLDRKQYMPALHDTSFSVGKVGFWTKSDSVSYFVDTKIQYTPRSPFGQTVVRDVMKKYRILGLWLYAGKSAYATRIVGCHDESKLGEEGGQLESAAIKDGNVYFLRSKDYVEVTTPVRDRNGEIVAAMRVRMKTFLGETESNAVNRAGLINKAIRERMGAISDLSE